MVRAVVLALGLACFLALSRADTTPGGADTTPATQGAADTKSFLQGSSVASDPSDSGRTEYEDSTLSDSDLPDSDLDSDLPDSDPSDSDLPDSDLTLTDSNPTDSDTSSPSPQSAALQNAPASAPSSGNPTKAPIHVSDSHYAQPGGHCLRAGFDPVPWGQTAFSKTACAKLACYDNGSGYREDTCASGGPTSKPPNCNEVTTPAGAQYPDCCAVYICK